MDRDAWDERYRAEGLLWRAEPNQFLVAEVAHLAPGRALDLACGEGRNAVWLARLGWDVTGVDFSPVALGKARDLMAEAGVDVNWIEADLDTWEPPPHSFDLVVSLYLHLPAGRRRLVNQRAAAALRPGGTYLVVGHALANLEGGHGGPQDPAVLYSPDDVAADLAGLDDLRVGKAEHVTRTVTAGSGHGGVPAGGAATAIDTLVRASRG